MDLLRVAVRPIGRHVVWSELHAHDPPIVGVEDVVEVVIGERSTIEHSSPEGAFGREVARVENDHTSHDSHHVMMPADSTGQVQEQRCAPEFRRRAWRCARERRCNARASAGAEQRARDRQFGALLIQCERDSRLCRSVANVPPTQRCWR